MAGVRNSTPFRRLTTTVLTVLSTIGLTYLAACNSGVGTDPPAQAGVPTNTDTDKDGVANAVDACGQTPPGVEVDATGCAVTVSWSTQVAPFVTLLFYPPPATYDVRSDGSLVEAHFDLADASMFLSDPFGSPPADGVGTGSDQTGASADAGSGPSDAPFAVTVLSDSAGVGEQVDLVRMASDGADFGLPITLVTSVTYNVFDVDTAPDGTVTWTFDVTNTIDGGFLISGSIRFAGSATGTVSPDGSAIAWQTVTGTLTNSFNGLIGSGDEQLPLGTLFPLLDDGSGILPPWTRVDGP